MIQTPPAEISPDAMHHQILHIAQECRDPHGTCREDPQSKPKESQVVHATSALAKAHSMAGCEISSLWLKVIELPISFQIQESTICSFEVDKNRFTNTI